MCETPVAIEHTKIIKFNEDYITLTFLCVFDQEKIVKIKVKNNDVTAYSFIFTFISTYTEM